MHFGKVDKKKSENLQNVSKVKLSLQIKQMHLIFDCVMAHAFCCAKVCFKRSCMRMMVLNVFAAISNSSLLSLVPFVFKHLKLYIRWNSKKKTQQNPFYVIFESNPPDEISSSNSSDLSGA